MATKKFMFVNRKAPYGTAYALESLEVVLISAAFDQDVSLAFIDDGVYQITNGQDTQVLVKKTSQKRIKHWVITRSASFMLKKSH
jgi:tRNA 2-thiouridine synthesizing protein C